MSLAVIVVSAVPLALPERRRAMSTIASPSVAFKELTERSSKFWFVSEHIFVGDVFNKMKVIAIYIGIYASSVTSNV
jgi:hypothetical protein